MIERLSDWINQAFTTLNYKVSARINVKLEERDAKREPRYDDVSCEPRKADWKTNPTQFGFSHTLLDLLDDDFRSKNLDLMQETGWKVLRVEFPWTYLRDGKLSFEQIDGLVDDCSKRGIELLPVLGTWTRGDPTPPDLEQFLPHVEEVVRRYQGEIRMYEIWNEPNLPLVFWKGSAVEFARLLKHTYNTIKEVDQGIKVGINLAWACAGEKEPWLLEYLGKLHNEGAVKPLDFISLHGYPGSWEPGGPEDWEKRIGQTRKWLEERGLGTELWVGECGYYSFPWENRLFAPHTPKRQAEYVRKICRIMKKLKVPVALWHSLADMRNFSDNPTWHQKLLFMEHLFGLFKKNMRLKHPRIIEILKQAAR